MSEKVQIEIQDDNDEDQLEEQTSAEDQSFSSQQSDGDKVVNDDEIAPPEEDDLAIKLESAEQQVQDHYDRLLRLSAEFDNYKKRVTREMRDLAKYANEKLIIDLLTVVDNLERAIDSAAQDSGADDALVQGVHLTLNEISKILERNRVEPVKALGEPFDPNFHQAMMQKEVEDQPANTVIQEMQKGYVIHDRLLRPSMVVVSKAKTSE